MASQDHAIDPHAMTRPFQLTKTMHRDVYPAVSPTNPKLSAKGKIVIVTGAAGGMGYRVVEAWALAGAEGIVLVGRTEKTLKQAAKVAGKVPTLVVPVDITSEKAVDELFANVKQHFGRADVLVHAAAVIAHSTVDESKTSVWWSHFETNVLGTYLLNRGFVKVFGALGTIINFTTVGALLAAPGSSAYLVSKLAALRFTEIVASEYPDLRVFSLHPGITLSEDGRGDTYEPFVPFSLDKQSLAAAVTLWLSTPSADCLRGGYMSVNWDVTEIEAHKEEIKQNKLNHTAMLNGKLGPEGHPWQN